MLQSCQLSPVTDYQGNTSNMSSCLLEQPILFVQLMSYEDIFLKHMRPLVSAQDLTTGKKHKISKILTFILKYAVLVYLQTITIDVKFKYFSYDI